MTTILLSIYEIYTNEDIPHENKLPYLIKATDTQSSARDFPPTGVNYFKSVGVLRLILVEKFF